MRFTPPSAVRTGVGDYYGSIEYAFQNFFIGKVISTTQSIMTSGRLGLAEQRSTRTAMAWMPTWCFPTTL